MHEKGMPGGVPFFVFTTKKPLLGAFVYSLRTAF
jgi:hypothetical protein